MNKELKDITITVCATQDTVESDSFNNTYDENATYPVVNVTEPLTNGGVVAVTEDIQTNNIEDTAAVLLCRFRRVTLVINGGTFACEPFDDPYGYNFLINCVDSAYKNGTAKVIIQGGAFINFDLSNNSAEGAGTNFVADGYKVVPQTQTNGDIWYTVAAE